MAKKKNTRKNVGGSKTSTLPKSLYKTHHIDIRQTIEIGTKNLRAGNLGQAKELFQQVSSAEPSNLAALYYLGVIAYQTGDIDKGEQFLNKAVAVNPAFVDGHNLLGILLEARGEMQGAIQSYEKVISINPKYAEAYNNLGQVYYISGQFEPAIANFINAIIMDKKLTLAQNNLENILRECNDLEKVITSYLENLTNEENDFLRCWNLAKALQNCGESRFSLKAFLRALLIRPNHGETHRSISKLKKYCNKDTHIKDMERIYGDLATPDLDKMHLAFALGKAYEDCREYDLAFENLLNANTFIRKTLQYSTDDTVKLNDTIKETFNSIINSQHLIRSSPDRTPLFILGMPRSGTSLVEQILASHPEVFGAGEIEYLANIFLQLSNTRQLVKAFDRCGKEFINILPTLGMTYVQNLKGLSPTSSLITDKMPYNFRLIGLICLALPNARIIHCNRNPIDNCLSIYKNYFMGVHPYAWDMEELGKFYLLYRDLMQYWHMVFPGRIHDVTYEKLVEDQEGETRKLLETCGLEWNDACLSFYKTSRSVRTASTEQVRRPIYKDSVQLWKKYEKHLTPLKNILDNDSTSGPLDGQN